jgi:hypothetical protein
VPLIDLGTIRRAMFPLCSIICAADTVNVAWMSTSAASMQKKYGILMLTAATLAAVWLEFSGSYRR